MADETASSSKSNIFWGLFAASMGAFIVAGASGLFGLDLHPTDGTPQWVGICAGAIFLAGGFAVVLQSLPAAKPMPDGSMSPDAPLWVQRASLLLCLSIVGSFVAILVWIAFGPGERHFSSNVPFLTGHTNEVVGRVVFGFCAVLAGAMFFAYLIFGTRRLLRRDKA
jgi:hypothetical protein